MKDVEQAKAESRTHYRLNREGLAVASRRLKELADELLRAGTFGEVGVTLKVTDGIIADVDSVRRTVERIRRRRKRTSLKGGGRQGDTREDVEVPSDDEREEPRRPTSDREDDASRDET